MTNGRGSPSMTLREALALVTAEAVVSIGRRNCSVCGGRVAPGGIRTHRRWHAALAVVARTVQQ